MLIGLTGKARSGKDTVGDWLETEIGFQRVAFAGALKEGLATMLGLSERHVHGDLKETVLPEFGKSPRQMMQSLGTEWGRMCVCEDIWLIVAKNKVEYLMSKGYSVVLTDVRFDNEAALVREMGGEVWHIQRDAAQKVNAHQSEAGVAKLEGDFLLENNSTLDSLYAKIGEKLCG